MPTPDHSVDLTNCDREPIHLLGSIHPIGFLIVVSTDWIVARASANIGTFLGFEPKSMIGSRAKISTLQVLR